MYEGIKDEVTIAYPRRYSLKSDAEALKEAESLNKIVHNTPSPTYQKEITKRIADVTLGNKITHEKLQKIHTEIDAADIIDTDPEIIIKDVEVGILDLETASQARGYPKGTVEKAKQDHAERLARINEAQAAIADRGNPDTTDSQDGKNDKAAGKQTDKDPIVKDKIRGKNNG